MNRIQTYQIYPTIPHSISFLEILSRNLWWCWKPDAIDLFRRIDPKLWESSGRNPIVLFANVSQKRLKELAKDDSFLAHLHRVKSWFEKRVAYSVDAGSTPYGQEGAIAYFSMEFGLHESIPFFAGGLGILAGDHLKAASNMALPLVGVGLLYRNGYFRQFLDADGLQQETYPETELYQLPVERARDPNGAEINISVSGPEGRIHAGVWRIRVGRIPLYLLDTNLPENPPEIRGITARLYAAETRIRLAQEVLLGIGGLRALAALGIFPRVCHMNEGHSVFSGLERLAQLRERYHLDLKTALEIVPRVTVFTTHTPVSAGHEVFPVDMVKPYISSFQDRLGVTESEILSWGQPACAGPEEPFSMFLLGLRLAQNCNGVSQLHGKVARRMWAHVWPEVPEEEIPISHVTNGIHISSWISPEIAMLFERHLGPDWYMGSRKSENADRIAEIYDDELWRAHEMNRGHLIRLCREMLARQYQRRNAPQSVLTQVESVLEQDVLTIAFARRFATYKRASLLFQDPCRLKAIVNSSTHPVQFIFAGKAHPKDTEGKALIKRVIEFAREPELRQRIVFIEDYDMRLARHLVQGADVWLNTPRRPFEACGTSGMKAAANGVLNLSVLDGWWCEGWTEDRGWRIGSDTECADPNYGDVVDSQSLYNILENEVIPCFYDHRAGGMPARWIRMIKESMKMAMQDYCSLRMVGEYEQRFYLPIARRFQELTENNGALAKNLSIQNDRIHALWKDIRIDLPVQDRKGPYRVGETFHVTAGVHLGQLRPDEVDVELYTGHMRSVDSLDAIHTEPMIIHESLEKGFFRYACSVTCSVSGRYGFTVRITPHGDEKLKFTPGLISWS
jgi:glycogen phosphorylase